MKEATQAQGDQWIQATSELDTSELDKSNPIISLMFLSSIQFIQFQVANEAKKAIWALKTDQNLNRKFLNLIIYFVA